MFSLGLSYSGMKWRLSDQHSCKATEILEGDWGASQKKGEVIHKLSCLKKSEDTGILIQEKNPLKVEHQWKSQRRAKVVEREGVCFLNCLALREEPTWNRLINLSASKKKCPWRGIISIVWHFVKSNDTQYLIWILHTGYTKQNSSCLKWLKYSVEKNIEK